MEDKNKKKHCIKLEDLTLKELLDYEKACKIVMNFYDNSTRLHDNSFEKGSDEALKKLILYGTMHNSIIGFIESKIKELE